jgi:DNA-binding SARP family transcriptional activator
MDHATALIGALSNPPAGGHHWGKHPQSLPARCNSSLHTGGCDPFHLICLVVRQAHGKAQSHPILDCHLKVASGPFHQRPNSGQSQALLCYLAATGRPHSREKLAGLLWGDKPEARAKGNLRKSLSTLRKLYGDALSITRQTAAFNRDSAYWLNVEVFESALAEDGPASEELRPLREAVDLYRGEFLEGFSVRQALAFEEWVLSERERLRQMVIQALQRLSVACTGRGEVAAAIEYTNRLLALHLRQMAQLHRQYAALVAVSYGADYAQPWQAMGCRGSRRSWGL